MREATCWSLIGWIHSLWEGLSRLLIAPFSAEEWLELQNKESMASCHSADNRGLSSPLPACYVTAHLPCQSNWAQLQQSKLVELKLNFQSLMLISPVSTLPQIVACDTLIQYRGKTKIVKFGQNLGLDSVGWPLKIHKQVVRLIRQLLPFRRLFI